jgi:N-carbamoyl-L-amino-acid hydrolase
MRDQDELRSLTDRDGIALPDALREHGVDLDGALAAHSQLAGAVAYLELHIEQGPVLESLDLPLGVVLGTFGVERSRFTWRGQAAHAGSTPMNKRRDALAGAAKLALHQEIAAEVGGGAVHLGRCGDPARHRHVGRRDGQALLDQRRLGGRAGSHAAAGEEAAGASPPRRTSRSVRRIWSIRPSCSTRGLIALADGTVREVSGTSHKLPSGPLHDAAEVSRRHPDRDAVRQSLRGLSHTEAGGHEGQAPRLTCRPSTA